MKNYNNCKFRVAKMSTWRSYAEDRLDRSSPLVPRPQSGSTAEVHDSTLSQYSRVKQTFSLDTLSENADIDPRLFQHVHYAIHPKIAVLMRLCLWKCFASGFISALIRISLLRCIWAVPTGVEILLILWVDLFPRSVWKSFLPIARILNAPRLGLPEFWARGLQWTGL